MGLLFDIRSISTASLGGGGEANIEAAYRYEQTGGVGTYPETPYVEGAPWLTTNTSDYLNLTSSFNACAPTLDAGLMYDDSEETFYNPASNIMILANCNGAPISKITLIADIKSGQYYLERLLIYGTDDASKTLNTSTMTLLDTIEVNANLGKNTYIKELATAYKYICLVPNAAPGIQIYDLKVEADSTIVQTSLVSTNMTPQMVGTKGDYLQFVTIPFYDGTQFIGSQRMVYKPYADGGCLIDYVDDGSAAHLMMYLITGTADPKYVLTPTSSFPLPQGYTNKLKVSELQIPAHPVVQND